MEIFIPFIVVLTAIQSVILYYTIMMYKEVKSDNEINEEDRVYDLINSIKEGDIIDAYFEKMFVNDRDTRCVVVSVINNKINVYNENCKNETAWIDAISLLEDCEFTLYGKNGKIKYSGNKGIININDDYEE